MDRRMDEWTDRWMDRRMDVWTDRWMDRRMDGWTDRHTDRMPMTVLPLCLAASVAAGM